MNLYVGNLAPETTSEELRRAFQAHGTVSTVSLPASAVKQGFDGGSTRGYGFVSMPEAGEARAAQAALDAREIHGRPMTVRAARPTADRRRRG